MQSVCRLGPLHREGSPNQSYGTESQGFVLTEAGPRSFGVDVPFEIRVTGLVRAVLPGADPIDVSAGMPGTS
jgi:hypothetical protein